MTQTLYHEKRDHFDERGLRTELVEVILVHWSSRLIDGNGDFVLRKRVMVDGETVVEGRKAFNPAKHDRPEMIREAIALFDKLLEDHPNKALLQK